MSFGGRQPTCTPRDKNPSNFLRSRVLCSFQRAEFSRDEEKPAGNAVAFPRALTMDRRRSAAENRQGFGSPYLQPPPQVPRGLRQGPRASPAKRVAWGEEEQGSGRSFRRKAETETSGLCDDEGTPRGMLCRVATDCIHLISRLRRQLPLKGKPKRTEALASTRAPLS